MTEALPGAKPAMRRRLTGLGADPDAVARPSDFAQALFDLGATVCTPATPACVAVPVAGGLRRPARRHRGGVAGACREAAAAAALRRAFLAEDAAGSVLLRRRPELDLLGGMAELPGTEWRAAPWHRDEALGFAPMPADWRPAGQVRHGFTHFALMIELFAARVAQIEAEGFFASGSGD